jgi:hypothetical protein
LDLSLPKRQATCILFKETYWSSNEIHCHRTWAACDSGNTFWVQMYSPWTFDYNLHWSQESYLFKLHYGWCHSQVSFPASEMYLLNL